MDEGRFNTTIRKFLKEVGVTSQREIEKSVREAIRDGRLSGNEVLDATVTLEVGGIGLTHVIKGEIETG